MVHSSLLAVTSIPLDGSSKIKCFESPQTATPRDNFLFIPPDKLSARTFRFSPYSKDHKQGSAVKYKCTNDIGDTNYLSKTRRPLS